MKNFGFYLWLVTAASLGGWIAIEALDTDFPYKYVQEESFITPNPARSEGQITVNWKFAQPAYRLCPGTIQRAFYTAAGELISTMDTTPVSAVVRKGDSRLPRSFTLPAGLSGDVLYSAKVCWECNVYQRLIRPICLVTPQLPLRVN